MEDQGNEGNQESLANEDLQAHPGHLDQEETQAIQATLVRQDLRDLRAAKDQGDCQELVVNLDKTVLLETPDLRAPPVHLENLDSVVKMEHPVFLAILVPLGHEAQRELKDILVPLDPMEHRDREEGLDQEVPQVTVDRKEGRVPKEKMVAMVTEDLQETLGLRAPKVCADRKEPGEKRVREVFLDRLVAKG